MDPESARDTASWAGGVGAAAGVWLIVAPFVLGYADLPGPRWNDGLIGAVILASIWFAAPFPPGGLGRVHAALGAWLVAAPLVLGYARVGGAITEGPAVTEDSTLMAIGAAVAYWNDIIVGLAVLVLALWSMAVARPAFDRRWARSATPMITRPALGYLSPVEDDGRARAEPGLETQAVTRPRIRGKSRSTVPI